MKILSSLMLAVLLCSNAVAGEIDFSFNSDAVRLLYIHDWANRDLQSDFGVLYHQDEGWVVNTSLYITGFASDGDNPLQAGLGGRTGYVSGDLSGQNGIPLAVGGFVKYTLPRLNRVNIRGEAWFAPDILSAGDLDKYQDYTLRVGYNVIKQADLYVGWRFVQGKFSNGTKADFDDGANIGFNIRF